tara:strand:+ start:531 stop:827 length:297 start_codon:yes stop_codon:yes gene_type:complete
MSDIIKWLAELTPEGKRTVIAMLLSDTPEPEKTEVRKTSGLYHKVYGSKFKEIYDKIECSGKPIRGSGHQLTPTEFKKIVNRCHTYAKEQRDLGYPDD